MLTPEYNDRLLDYMVGLQYRQEGIKRDIDSLRNDSFNSEWSDGLQLMHLNEIYKLNGYLAVIDRTLKICRECLNYELDEETIHLEMGDYDRFLENKFLKDCSEVTRRRVNIDDYGVKEVEVAIRECVGSYCNLNYFRSLFKDFMVTVEKDEDMDV